MPCLYFADRRCIWGKYGGKPSPGTCRQCPDNTEAGIWPTINLTPSTPASSLPSSYNWSIEGPRLWKIFHSFPDTMKWRPEEEQRRLNRFLHQLPCGTCRSHALRWVADNPADFTSTEAYRTWGISLHNAVNLRLGKPLWTG